MPFQLYQKQEQSILPDFYQNDKINNPALYLPSDALVDAVNVALAIGQPLLLTGDPGTGKTQLAYHVAHQFNLNKPLIFNAQTSSVATDLFYKYDALAHFQYNQNNKEPLSTNEIEKRFINFNALGEAIRQQKRLVVLIDEIDKAPRDFPNDLLFNIENLSFKIPELDNKVFEATKNVRPIIVLTSNSEKNLPDAFLRRVAYFHIPFPSPEDLLIILSKKMDGLSDTELKSAVAYFQTVRDMKLKKAPATSELIYWVVLLQQLGFPFSKLNTGNLSASERNQLQMSYAVLAKNKEDLDVLKNSI